MITTIKAIKFYYKMFSNLLKHLQHKIEHYCACKSGFKWNLYLYKISKQKSKDICLKFTTKGNLGKIYFVNFVNFFK